MLNRSDAKMFEEEFLKQQIKEKKKIIRKNFREMCRIMEEELNYSDKEFNDEIQKLFVYMRKYKRLETELTDCEIAAELKISVERVQEILKKNRLYLNRFFGRWQKDEVGKWKFLYFYERVCERCKDFLHYTGV